MDGDFFNEAMALLLLIGGICALMVLAGFGRWIIEQSRYARHWRDVSPDALDVVEQLAGECDNCKGSGRIGVMTAAGPRVAPCPQCAYLRLILERADRAP